MKQEYIFYHILIASMMLLMGSHKGGDLTISKCLQNADNDTFVVISKTDMLLKVLNSQGTILKEYPIATGENKGNKQKKGDHRTPEGTFIIINIHDSSWWKHDFNDGKGEIAGAYGSFFIRLKTPGFTGIGIHGTHDPSSIGKCITEGCIRLRNEDVTELVSLIKIGNKVVINS